MRKFLFPLLAAAALVGCSKEDSGSGVPQNDGPVEIKLASKAMTVTTRAPFEGDISSSNKLQALVPASTTSGDYSSPYGDSHACMVFADQGTTAVGFVGSDGSTPAPKYYPANGGNVYLCGLYPHDKWGTPTTAASATIDGKTDLMYAKEVTTTKTDVQTGGTPKTLAFNHLLTKLDIVLLAESETAKTTWGKVTSLKLTKQGTAAPHNSVSVTFADGNATTSGSAADGFDCYLNGGDTPVSSQELVVGSSTDAVAYVLCAPVNAETGTDHYTMSVATENNPSAIEVPLTLQYAGDFDGSKISTAGQAFKVTLTFKSTQIEAKATVTAWKEAGTATGDIQ